MYWIVEGPDSSGKTGLIDMVGKETGTEVIHTGGPQPDKNVLRGIMDSLLRKKDIIIDRLPIISETVYGEVLRGQSLFSPIEFDAYFSYLKLKNPIIIYCRPPREVIHEVRDKREENKPWKSKEHIAAVKANLDKIITKYDDIMRYIHDSIGLGVLIWNFKNNVALDELELGNLVLESMRHHKWD